MKKLLFLFIAMFIISCNAQDCNSLPKTFTNYSDAISKITKADFSITDSVNTSSSSWITEASSYGTFYNKFLRGKFNLAV